MKSFCFNKKKCLRRITVSLVIMTGIFLTLKKYQKKEEVTKLALTEKSASETVIEYKTSTSEKPTTEKDLSILHKFDATEVNEGRDIFFIEQKG